MNKTLQSRIVFFALFVAAFLAAYFFFPARETAEPATETETETSSPGFHLLVNKLVEEKGEVLGNDDDAVKIEIAGVPFTSQAPSAQWDNSVYQDGCEEAASLMAVYWAEGKGLSKSLAESEIAAISDYEVKNYGGYHDTAAEDTAERIIQGYFGYDKFEVIKDASLKDIIEQIKNGRLVVAPFDGQLLGNPNYTAPGPERHALVIKGYDSAKKEFITNDPGTRKGADYRYNEEVLYNALRDYPTGDHLPITGIEKNIIAVWK